MYINIKFTNEEYVDLTFQSLFLYDDVDKLIGSNKHYRFLLCVV